MGQQPQTQQAPPQPIIVHQQPPQSTAQQPAPAPPPTRGRKRKSPPSKDQGQQPPPPPPGAVMSAPIPVPLPPHMIAHLPGPLPPGFVYAPSDFTPGGMPQPQNGASSPEDGSMQLDVQVEGSGEGQQNRGQGRQLSTSKRAEQNRKAQRAFRERRDQHVKALESRSQLLDAALASADEANRRWEECRTLVDQLRVENAALRAALSQAQLMPPGTTIVVGGPEQHQQHPQHQHQHQQQQQQHDPHDPQSAVQDDQDNDPVIRSQPVRNDGEHS
ncbi:hypothetical protein HDZ31DRAFT_38078 [Schizophyllum fasciatum]